MIIALGAALVLIAPPAHAGGFMQGSGFVGEPGHTWVKLSYMRWQADEVFAGIFDRNASAGVGLGDPIAFDSSVGGHFDSQAVATNLVFIPMERTRLALYFPVYQAATFEDDVFESTTTGTGDVWVSGGYQLTPDDLDVATTVGLQLKVPTTTLPREFENVPLSEGQYDLAVEQVTTWAVLPSVHISLQTLLRRRFAFSDENRTIKPGDEAELGLAVGGGPLSWLWVKAGYSGLWSTGTEDQTGTGSVSLVSRRHVNEVMAGAYVKWGQLVGPSLDSLALDASASFPVSGQDYPRGLSWSLGVAWSAQLR
ncbi:MAG: hypothetical protein ACLFVJ_22185 [Persicimonas sp.]